MYMPTNPFHFINSVLIFFFCFAETDYFVKSREYLTIIQTIRALQNDTDRDVRSMAECRMLQPMIKSPSSATIKPCVITAPKISTTPPATKSLSAPNSPTADLEQSMTDAQLAAASATTSGNDQNPLEDGIRQIFTAEFEDEEW